MKTSKRRYGLLAALLCAAASAVASPFPTKPVTLIVPYPAGGASDAAARAYATPLSNRLGQPVLVENLGGAGGAVAAQKMLGAPADGHLLFFGSPTEVILVPMVNAAVKYKAEDFRLLLPNAVAPLVVLVRKSLPVNSVDELIALARKSSAEGKPLSYGTTGIGSVYHLVTEHFGQRIGAKLNHVPYKGAAPLLQDLAGDQVDFSLLVYQASMDALAEQGRFRMLASLGATRPETLKQLPTVNESKTLKNFDFTIWGGFFVKKDTPPEVFQQLHKAVSEARNSPELQAYREAQRSIKAPDMTSQEAAKFFEGEVARYRALVKAVGLKPE